MNIRPHLRRGRVAHLELLDDQRPRVRLERMPRRLPRPSMMPHHWLLLVSVMFSVGLLFGGRCS